MSEDLRTDHVKLNKKNLFCPAIGGEAGPPASPLCTPVGGEMTGNGEGTGEKNEGIGIHPT